MRSVYTLCFALSSMLLSCNQQNEAITTTISGEILNPVSQTVSFYYGEEKVTDSLNDENKFVTSFDITQPTEVRFKHGREFTTIYLTPGDQLDLKLDPTEFDESLTYTGRGAEANNYNAAMVLLQDSLIGFRQMARLPEDSFLMVLDSVTKIKLSSLEDFNISDTAFVEFIRMSATWDKATKKLDYPGMHKFYLKLDSFNVSEKYYTFLEGLDISDSSHLKYPPFHSFVKSYVHHKTSEKNSDYNNHSSYFKAYFETLEEEISIPSLKEQLYYRNLSYALPRLNEAESEKPLANWKKLNPSEEHMSSIEEIIEGWKDLKPGKPAPSFAYASLNGDTLKLEDFRGQLVYIDVWATWCGPCIREHPAMEKLQEDLAHEGVAFVAISIDDSPEPWKKMVAKKELGGIHLYADGAWGSEIVKDYMIQGIPRFILIDEEGKIISADAQRPSGDIKEQILEELYPAT